MGTPVCPSQRPKYLSFTKMRPVPQGFHSLLPLGTCSAGPSRHLVRGLPCFPLTRWLCYNRPAVERAVKQAPALSRSEPARAQLSRDAASQAGFTTAARQDASRYCPVCSHRLESRRCKLVCAFCGYYMSCADYY